MLALSVPPQVHLALEALGTQLAAERLEPRVFSAVRDEVGALAEGFPAYLAFVGLLTCKCGGQLRREMHCCPVPLTFPVFPLAHPSPHGWILYSLL